MAREYITDHKLGVTTLDSKALFEDPLVVTRSKVREKVFCLSRVATPLQKGDDLLEIGEGIVTQLAS